MHDVLLFYNKLDISSTAYRMVQIKTMVVFEYL